MRSSHTDYRDELEALTKACRLANPDILFNALKLLLSLIGHDNPVLRGSAYLQVREYADCLLLELT